MKNVADIVLFVLMVLLVVALNFFAYGCVSDRHSFPDPPPADVLAISYGMIQDFEHAYYPLTWDERDCVTTFDYQEFYSYEDIQDACWQHVTACTLFNWNSKGYSTMKVWHRVGPGNWEFLVRHETMHLILWCAGEPGSTDHSNPAWELVAQ